jgi:PAS domain-containing protein
MQAKRFLRWERMLSNGYVIHGPVETFPDAEQAALSTCGIHTLVVVPLFVRRAWWGFIEFDHCLGTRHWTAKEVEGLIAAARVFGAALQAVRQGHNLEPVLTALDATLESTGDGRLVVDDQGHLLGLNQRLLSMWRVPDVVAESRTLDPILTWMKDRLTDPEALMRTIRELSSQPDADSYDILELKDGRRIERFSKPKRESTEFSGRVWCFHEIASGWPPTEALDRHPLQNRENVR